MSVYKYIYRQKCLDKMFPFWLTKLPRKAKHHLRITQHYNTRHEKRFFELLLRVFQKITLQATKSLLMKKNPTLQSQGPDATEQEQK